MPEKLAQNPCSPVPERLDPTSSDRKREEILCRIQHLERTHKQLEQFVYAVSHDLNEPLRTIQNFLGLLQSEKERELGEESHMYLSRINRAVDHMGNLLDDLLMYSRSGKVRNPEALDLNAILEEVQEQMADTISRTKAQILSGPLPSIRGHKQDMQTLFFHVLDNAIKFAKKDIPPIVKLSTSYKGDQTLICIEDNGIGIEEKYHEKVFGVFQRLHPRGEYRGNGIGLALCRRIVHSMSGSMYLESELGRGTQAYLVFQPSK